MVDLWERSPEAMLAGDSRGMKGKKHTEETKRGISDAKKRTSREVRDHK